MQQPTTVAVGILQVQGEFLVAQRVPGKPFAGFWEFPGGKLENAESSQDALVRELREELGIEVVTCQEFMRFDASSDDLSLEIHAWLVTAYEGRLIANEGQLIRWVDGQSLTTLTFPPANQPLIQKLRETQLKP